MTKDEALAMDLALEALEAWLPTVPNLIEKKKAATTAIKQARALDKKAENARELGLDYEPEERYTYGTPLLDAFTKPAPVQEPVGTYGEIYESMKSLLRSGLQKDQQIYMAMKDKPLYTTPPAAQRQWVGLTDEEFEDIELGCRSTSSGKIEAMQKVEAKLKEKNSDR